jgi:hypothetical protein
MEVSCCEKIALYCSYLSNKYKKKYKKVFIVEDDNKYTDITDKLNSYCESNKYFGRPQKVIVNYTGEKEFNVSFKVQNYEDIKNLIDIILRNNSNYHPKIKTVFPNFIESIYFVKNNGGSNVPDSIDVKNFVDETLDFENNSITFLDIAFMLKINPREITSLKIVYVKDFKKSQKILNFSEYMNKDIEILNSIYTDNVNKD